MNLLEPYKQDFDSRCSEDYIRDIEYKLEEIINFINDLATELRSNGGAE